jgi:uncharacterized protein (TIGR02452 family)
MNRERRIKLAQKTLDIIAAGSYTAPSGTPVEIAADLQSCLNRTRLYRPIDFPVELTGNALAAETKVEVTAETTLEAAQRLVAADATSQVLCLNFASARHPGGGFLGGSQAQEESLARSSGLYASLISQMEMYEFNRQERSLLYSDHMIYSPDVPVFRADTGLLLDVPYRVSFITAPAVNAGAVKKNQPQSVPEIQPAMARRLQKLLWVAATLRHKTLVLGAWGCGVFQNSPAMVASLFAQQLGQGGAFHGCFKHIVFAVFDRTEEQKVLRAFQDLLAV